LRDPLAVFVGTPSGIGVDTLDESKLTSRRHRLSSACAPASIAGARKTLEVGDSQDSSARLTVMVRSPDS
jgi:hypothetical protein